MSWLIYSLFAVAPMCVGVCVWSLFSNVLLSFLYSVSSSCLDERAGCFILSMLWLPCGYQYDVFMVPWVGWSVVVAYSGHTY